MSKRFSFEFFPPKTEKGQEKLKTTRARLNELGPSFFSVTYGAGGSTRDNTRNVVLQMKSEGLPVAPHLSFAGDSKEDMLEMLETYKSAGIDRIVALRGDQPADGGTSEPVYARRLVEFIREHTGDHFHLEVAAYPEIHPDAPGYDDDIRFLKEKLDAGGDTAITQFFFNADAYFYFVDRCRKFGIDKPIYPGIMPIINFANLQRFSANCGADIPRWLTYKMEQFGDDQDAVIDFGNDVVTRLCETLLQGGAPGLHFYTMNQAGPVSTIWHNLKLPVPQKVEASGG